MTASQCFFLDFPRSLTCSLCSVHAVVSRIYIVAGNRAYRKRSSTETVSFEKQNFVTEMKANMCSLSFKYFFGGILLGYSLVFSHVTHLDQSRASENIWYIYLSAHFEIFKRELLSLFTRSLNLPCPFQPSSL